MTSTGIFECCAMIMIVSCRSKTLSCGTISPWDPKPLHKFFPFLLFVFVSTQVVYEDAKIVDIEMGLLSFDEKLGLVPLAPLPMFPYS